MIRLPTIVTGAFKNIEVALTTNVAGFAAEMAMQAATVKRFGDEVYASAEKGNTAARGLGAGMMAAGAAIAAGFAVSIEKAAAFEKSMANVNSILFESQSQLKATSNEVLNISVQTGKSATDLAGGLYKVASAQFTGADATTVLAASARAAVAGLSTTDVAATALTGSLRAYGAGADQATHYTDIMLRTVQVGQTTFPELAQNMSQFIAISAALKIPLEDAAGAFAAMTNQGVPAAQASTQLGRIMATMLKPTKELSDQFHMWGFESGAAAVQAIGLDGVIKKIAESTNGNVVALHALVPDIRAFRGVLELTNNGGQVYADTLGKVRDNTDATKKSFDEQAKSLAFQWGQFTAAISKVAIEVGTVLLPVMKTVIGGLMDLVNVFENIPAPIQTVIVGFGALAAVALLVGGAFLFFAPKIVAAQAVWASFTAGQTGGAAAMAASAANTQALTLQVDQLQAAVTSAEAAVLNETIGTNEWAVAMDRATAAQLQLVAATRDLQMAQNSGAQSSTLLGTAMGGLAAAMIPVMVAMNAERIHGFFENIRIGGPHITDLEAKLLALGRTGGNTAANLKAVQDAARFDNTSLKNEFLSFFGDTHPNNDLTTRLHDADKALSQLVQSGHADEAKAAIADLATQLGKSPDELINHLHSYKDAVTQKAIADDAANKATDEAARKAKVAQDAIDAEAQAARDAANAAESYKQEMQKLNSALSSFESPQTALSAAADQMAGIDPNKHVGSSGTTVKSQAQLENAINQAKIDGAKATVDVMTAEDALNKVRRDGNSIAIVTAQLEADKAAHATTKATLDLATAQDHLNRVRLAGGGQQFEQEAVLQVQTAQDMLTESKLKGTDAANKLALAQSPRGQAEALMTAENNLAEAHQKVAVAAEALIQANKKEDGSLTGTQGKVDLLSVSLKGFNDQVDKQNANQQNWEKNLMKIVERGAPQSVVDQLVKMGVNGAGITAQMATSTDTDFKRISESMQTQATIGSTGYATNLQAGLEVARIAVANHGTMTVEGLTNAYNQLPGVVQKSVGEMTGIIKQYGVAIQVTSGAGSVIDLLSGSGSGDNSSKVAPVTHTHAMGGFENHQATIGTPGVQRIWNEPETGGEAYIPLDPSKRGRSLNVLKTVADIFGVQMFDAARGATPRRYASGGVEYMPGGAAAGSGWHGTPAPIMVPVSSATNYQFSGPIQGVRMEEVETYARRKKALQNMASGSGLISVG